MAARLPSWFRGDLYAGLRAWPIWLTLGWNDIRIRYRRSALGPFWITLSTTVFVVTLGIIFSQIFHTDIRILSALYRGRLDRLRVHVEHGDGIVRLLHRILSI